MGIKETITSKLLSGKYLLTVCSGIVFVYCSVTGKLDATEIAAVTTMVFTLYFTKKDSNDKT